MTDLNKRAAIALGWIYRQRGDRADYYTVENGIYKHQCFVDEWQPASDPAQAFLLLEDERVVYYSITWHKGIVKVEIKVKHPNLDYATLRTVIKTDVPTAITAAFVAAMEAK